MKKLAWFFLLLSLPGCWNGCDISLPVTISNRLDDPIEVYANGESLGAVSPNGVQNFTVAAPPDNGASSYSNDYARVSFVFKNTNTGKSSRVFEETLYENRPKTIEVRESDFLF